jgi:SAM-dependent methyltransferase
MQTPVSPDVPVASRPWQLEMFDHSLKKCQKLEALWALMGNVDGKPCLLLTCGDNNGALNWHFREKGGHWTWGDVSGEHLDEMSQLLAEPVHQIPDHQFPFADGRFDCVVAIDVLEHLAEDQVFLREVGRVLRPGGRAVVTVPNGDARLLANRIKRVVGMRPAQYGHTRAGYTLAELRSALKQAGFVPTGGGGYSRFFTEVIELLINFSYVFVLARNRRTSRPGAIAPASSTEFKRHGAAYQLYARAFPLLKGLSQLDRLLPAQGNYAVITVASKLEEPGQDL